jgi:hypothetical protein
MGVETWVRVPQYVDEQAKTQVDKQLKDILHGDILQKAESISAEYQKIAAEASAAAERLGIPTINKALQNTINAGENVRFRNLFDGTVMEVKAGGAISFQRDAEVKGQKWQIQPAAEP